MGISEGHTEPDREPFSPFSSGAVHFLIRASAFFVTAISGIEENKFLTEPNNPEER